MGKYLYNMPTPKTDLKTFLRYKTNAELSNICRESGIRGFSGKKKQLLIEYASVALTQPDYLFVCLREMYADNWRLFWDVVTGDEPVVVDVSDVWEASILYGTFPDGILEAFALIDDPEKKRYAVVPDEVKAVFRKFDLTALDALKRFQTRIINVARAAANLYGVVYFEEFWTLLDHYEPDIFEDPNLYVFFNMYTNSEALVARWLSEHKSRSEHYREGDVLAMAKPVDIGSSVKKEIALHILRQNANLLSYYCINNEMIASCHLADEIDTESAFENCRTRRTKTEKGKQTIDYNCTDEICSTRHGKNRYLPTREIFLKYVDEEYYERTPHIDALRDFLIQKLKRRTATYDSVQDTLVYLSYSYGGLPKQEMRRADMEAAIAKEIVDCEQMNVLLRYATGERIEPIQETLRKLGADLDESEFETLVRLDMNINNTTRMWENYGHTPNEIFERTYSPSRIRKLTDLLADNRFIVTDVLPEASNIIPFPTPEPPKTVAKVGRNDPCPCGSGKKYKNCCGKKI